MLAYVSNIFEYKVKEHAFCFVKEVIWLKTTFCMAHMLACLWDRQGMHITQSKQTCVRIETKFRHAWEHRKANKHAHQRLLQTYKPVLQTCATNLCYKPVLFLGAVYPDPVARLGTASPFAWSVRRANMSGSSHGQISISKLPHVGMQTCMYACVCGCTYTCKYMCAQDQPGLPSSVLFTSLLKVFQQ